MSSLALLIAYLGCLSSGSMLSMLLLLVAAYVSAAIWLVSHGAYYSGLLYVLVYVGAIVVLIIFVVQLTNTSLAGDTPESNSNRLLPILQVTILLVSLSTLSVMATSTLGADLLLSLSSTGTPEVSSLYGMGDAHASLPSTLSSYIGGTESTLSGGSLGALASSIFNEHGYVLVVSVHAIVLAVIGPIKLALADLDPYRNS